MILLVVGGGPGTLKTIVETLKKGRPVIVHKWSGGVAREIASYFEGDMDSYLGDECKLDAG